MVIVLGFSVIGCGAGAKKDVDTDTRIVLDRSIGGVGLGARRADVERLIGRGTVLRTDDQKPPEPRFHFETVLYSNGLEVWYTSRSTSEASLAQGRVGAVITHSPLYTTPQNVHVGSPAADLQAIEGVHCYVENCQHGYDARDQPGTTFRLDFPGGHVTTIGILFGH